MKDYRLESLDKIFFRLDLFTLDSCVSLNPKMADCIVAPHVSLLITACRLLHFHLFKSESTTFFHSVGGLEFKQRSMIFFPNSLSLCLPYFWQLYKCNIALAPLVTVQIIIKKKKKKNYSKKNINLEK